MGKGIRLLVILVVLAPCAITPNPAGAQNSSRSPRDVNPESRHYRTPDQLEQIVSKLEQLDLDDNNAGSLSGDIRFAGEIAGAPYLSRVATAISKSSSAKTFYAIVVNCNDEYKKSSEMAAAMAKILHTVSDSRTTFTKVSENEPVEFLQTILSELDRKTSSPELAAALVKHRNSPFYRNYCRQMIERAELLHAGSSKSVAVFIEDLQQTEGGYVDWLRLRAVQNLGDLGPAAASAIPALERAVDEGTGWISEPAREAIRKISGADYKPNPGAQN